MYVHKYTVYRQYTNTIKKWKDKANQVPNASLGCPPWTHSKRGFSSS